MSTSDAERLAAGLDEGDASALMESLLQACDGTPDWYGISRKHWVMSLDRYKQIRRWTTQYRPDPEPDEEKWVPGPSDTLFGYPIEVREDAGEPHLVAALAAVYTGAEETAG